MLKRQRSYVFIGKFETHNQRMRAFFKEPTTGCKAERDVSEQMATLEKTIYSPVVLASDYGLPQEVPDLSLDNLPTYQRHPQSSNTSQGPFSAFQYQLHRTIRMPYTFQSVHKEFR